MGVAYVNVRVSRHLKEMLAWTIDKRPQVISKYNVIQNSYALLCVPLSNTFSLMRMKICSYPLFNQEAAKTTSQYVHCVQVNTVQHNC